MNVSLPSGMEEAAKKMTAKKSAEGVPAKAGHPEAILPSVRFFLMRCTMAQEQEATVSNQTKFQRPEELEWSCYQYFAWAEENPLTRLDTRFSGQHGKFYQAHVPQRRIFTVEGLCIYLGITPTTWKRYESDPVFKDTCEMVNAVMYHQKLEGAAVDHFNPGIITRHLGLADKKELSVGGTEQDEITDDMTPEQAAEIYQLERETK